MTLWLTWWLHSSICMLTTIFLSKKPSPRPHVACVWPPKMAMSLAALLSFAELSRHTTFAPASTAARAAGTPAQPKPHDNHVGIDLLLDIRIGDLRRLAQPRHNARAVEAHRAARRSAARAGRARSGTGLLLRCGIRRGLRRAARQPRARQHGAHRSGSRQEAAAAHSLLVFHHDASSL